MSNNIIEITDLRKELRGKQILNGLSVDIKEGETFVLVGQSGIGKSVLFKHITGIMHPDSGSIKIKGREPLELCFSRKLTSKYFAGRLLSDLGQSILPLFPRPDNL